MRVCIHVRIQALEFTSLNDDGACFSFEVGNELTTIAAPRRNAHACLSADTRFIGVAILKLANLLIKKMPRIILLASIFRI